MKTLVKRNGDFNWLPDFPNFFDDFFTRDMFNLRNFPRWENTMPAVNIMEKEKEFRIDVAAPGLEKDDFTIEWDNDMLIISCEKEEKKEEEKESEFTRKEFNYRMFRRTFNMPENLIVPDKIKAKYDNGILNIVVPKTTQAIKKSAKHIEIA